MENLPVRFLQPWFLFLLLLLPVFWMMALNSLAGLGKVRRWFALGLRVLIVALLIFACSQIQWRSPAENVAVYFLLDWSDSIPNAPAKLREDLLAYMEKASADRRKGALVGQDDLVGLIYFAEDATCESPPLPAAPPRERQAIIETDATDIASAVRLALSTLPPGSKKRIVLATDGNQNRGDALAEAQAARAQGAVVDVYPLQYFYDREIAAEKIVLPEKIQEGVPFAARAVISSTSDARGRLTLSRGGVPVENILCDLKKGRNVVAIPTVAVSEEDKPLLGLLSYAVTVEAVNSEDDHITQNNTAEDFTRIQGPPTVLYIDGNIGFEEGYEPRLHAELAQKLKLIARGGSDKADVKLHLVTVAEIPSTDELNGYDCIIIDNVAAEDIGAPRMERIRTLVNDQGVGLVMIGGERSFGAGNYLDTPLEKALPVDMDLKHKKVMPNGALAIILHTCEFQNGNWWAKEITKKAITSLSPHDYAGVLYFSYNGGDRWLFKLQPASDKPRLKRMIDTVEPEDMPAFDPTVTMAVQALQSTPASLRHIIIISDGDPSPPSPAVQALIKNDKSLTLSAIAIGSHSVQNIMKPLAENIGGGRFYMVQDPKKLPQIFVKETMVVKKSLLMEKPFTPDRQQRESRICGKGNLGRPAPTARLYRNHGQTVRRRAAGGFGERPCDRRPRPQPYPRALAVRPGPGGRLYQRREKPLGTGLAGLE